MTDALEQKLSLSKLLDVDSFREVCRSFSELYGIGVRIFDSSGTKLVDIRASTSDHCGYLFTVHPTKVMCTNLVNEIRTCELSPLGEAVSHDCFSGLRYKIMPIVHEGTVMGRVIFGPYAPDDLQGPPPSLRIYQENGLDLSRLGQYQRDIPRASEAAVGKVLNNLRNVLDVIIHASYKTHLTSQMHIASITGAFEDLERSNRDLKSANERLQDLDRLKSNFIATVSHELRTPLTSVIGYSEMLLEGMAGELNAEQKSYVTTILEKGESLLSLIGQVLDLSRIESGNVLMRKEPTDPKLFIHHAVSDVAPQAKKRQLDLQVSIADDVTPIVVDSDKIRRVLSNLLSNAVKFTGVGGTVSLTATVALAPPAGSDRFDIFEPERNRYLRISVTDTGVGIPDDKLEQVFDTFYQVDNSATREFGGSGLGLSIARNFVLAHSGRIELQSALGKGTTFTVLLPYCPDTPTSAVGVDGLEKKQAAS